MFALKIPNKNIACFPNTKKKCQLVCGSQIDLRENGKYTFYF